MKSTTPFNSRTESLPQRKEISRNIKHLFMYGTACLGVSKLLQAPPKELNRFGSHSLDKATEFIREILPSSQISHRIPLDHCRLLSEAFTVTP